MQPTAVGEARNKSLMVNISSIQLSMKQNLQTPPLIYLFFLATVEIIQLQETSEATQAVCSLGEQRLQHDKELQLCSVT